MADNNTGATGQASGANGTQDQASTSSNVQAAGGQNNQQNQNQQNSGGSNSQNSGQGQNQGQSQDQDQRNQPGNLDELPEWARKEIREANKQAAGLRKKVEEIEAAELAKQGNYKTLVEKQTAIIAELEKKIANQERGLLVAKVAGKYKLPEALASRLAGQTEEELEKDAKELAKLVKPVPAPNTEAGATGRGAGAGDNAGGAAGGNQDRPVPGERAKKQYIFQKPGDLTW